MHTEHEYDIDNATSLSIQAIRSVFVATAQSQLTDDVIHQFRRDVLVRLHRSPIRALVLDLSIVTVMDTHQFALIRDTLAMVSLMGARAILCGLRPGVAASLVDLDATADGVDIAVNLDDAFARLTAGDMPANGGSMRSSRVARVGAR